MDYILVQMQLLMNSRQGSKAVPNMEVNKMGLDVNTNTAAYQDIKTPQYNSYGNSSGVQTESQTAQSVQAAQAAQAAQAIQAQVVIEPDSKGESKDSSSQNSAAQQIESAIRNANHRAKFGHTNAQFTYHEKTKRISIKIIDRETNEVIKEIPPEETLEMISKMWELAGLLVDEKR